ncbi:MAG: hypothetical protein QXO54_02425 [Candidatus Methanomethylicaceae archaeon]|nr:hypothetical protein [Candidatus Verstraetearchaeota archaeon]
MRYNIYLCRKCGAVCAGREGASSFTCCFCGTRNNTEKAVSVMKGIESRDVQHVIAQIKLSKVKS